MLSTWGSHLARARRSIKQEAGPGAGQCGCAHPSDGRVASQPASCGSGNVGSVAISEVHRAGRMAGFFYAQCLEISSEWSPVPLLSLRGPQEPLGAASSR